MAPVGAIYKDTLHQYSNQTAIGCYMYAIQILCESYKPPPPPKREKDKSIKRKPTYPAGFYKYMKV